MTNADISRIRLHDFAPECDDFRAEVLYGLQQPQKTLPCKFFYDERGSRLFDEICGLKEYYLTRTEVEIMRTHSAEMAALLGKRCLLVEYGSGSSVKTRILLDHLPEAAAYVPIDISKEHLMHSACSLAAAYPKLEVLPVCADYTRDFELPLCHRPVARRVVYFPGSTIGNLEPRQAQELFHRIAGVCGSGGGLLIGADLEKDAGILEPAYNDQRGVTAAFNLNLLERINRELKADFQLDQFAHYAPYNVDASRIEMHLVSLRNQMVHLNGTSIPFREGETIVTEYSYKYSLDDLARLAAPARLTVEEVWTDQRRLFSVQYLTLDC